MDFTQTATPVGGVDTPAYVDPNGVQRGSTHVFAAPLDRPAGRGLGLEVLHDREPLARAQDRIRIPVRDERSLLVDGPGGRSTTDESVDSSPSSPAAAVGTNAGAAARGLRERHADVRPADGQRGRPIRPRAGAKHGRVRSRQPAVPRPPSGGPVCGRRGLPDLGREAGSRASARPTRSGEKRQTLLRASYSRFADLFLDGIGLASPFASIQGIYYYWTDTNGNHHVDPGRSGPQQSRGLLQRGSRPIPRSSSAPNQISPNLKPTTVDEFVVGADQELLSRSHGLASTTPTAPSGGSSSARTSA